MTPEHRDTFLHNEALLPGLPHYALPRSGALMTPRRQAALDAIDALLGSTDKALDLLTHRLPERPTNAEVLCRYRQEACLRAPDLLEPSVPLGDPEQEAEACDWLSQEFLPPGVYVPESWDGERLLLLPVPEPPIWTLPYLCPGLAARVGAWCRRHEGELWWVALVLGLVVLAGRGRP